MLRFRQFLKENNVEKLKPKGDASRKTSLQKSAWSHDHAEAKWDHYQRSGKKEKIKDVPVEKLRATQSWVHKNYSAAHSRHYDYDHPYGVEDNDGNVHIIDGHHRSDSAKQKGEKMVKFRVVGP